MNVLAGGQVVTPGGVLAPGRVTVAAGRIASVCEGGPTTAADRDLSGHWLVPGFVDLHVHGGGGGELATTAPGAARRVAGFHRRHGTTTMLASLATAPLDDTARTIRALAELVHDGTLAGLHLEGPFLNVARCGAHRADLLRPPRSGEVTRLLGVAPGAVRMVTLAPELDGGIEAVRHIVAAGAIAAVGHSDASYEQTRAALDAGATVGTHLFNAMRPLHHRTPGAAAALLEDERVTVEVIHDGVHLHPAVVRLVVAVAGPGRVALITDAMAAAGCEDGTYRLAGRDVEVVHGVARLAPGGSIAGSTLTMDAAFRHTVRAGVAVEDAARMAATTPARVLGLDTGAIAPGLAADLVVLDRHLDVRDVMVSGKWLA